MSLVDPGDNLQAAVVAALKASAAIAACDVANPETWPRVYDDVPSSPAFPYITVGDDRIDDDSTECFDASKAHVIIHVWSRAVGFPECKRICAAVRSALTTRLDIEGQKTVEGLFETSGVFRDDDGKTKRGFVSFVYLLEPTGV